VSPVNGIGTVPGTVATSGVLGPPNGPFPSTYTYSFPETGSFTYQCRIHDHMRGAITSA
jgi:plastocyanin